MKRLLYAAACLLTIQFTQAQNPCGTDEQYKAMLKQNPELQAQIENQRKEFNAAFKEYLKTVDMKQFRVDNTFAKAGAPPKYIIPVVFHILHNNDSYNYTDQDIAQEILNMNNSYSANCPYRSRIRPIFKDIEGDAQIEFRLAKYDPNGNPTNGIERFYIGPMDEKANDNQKKNSWDPQRYLNIWSCASIRSNSSFAVGGYAYLPNGIPASKYDGPIVSNRIGVSSASIPFDLVTCTHEVGHYLGLLHPFQGSETDSCGLENDGIDDTPPVYYIPTTSGNASHIITCGSNPNSCATDNPDLPDQYENFMDYYTGACASLMFTEQQIARMHFSLEYYRRNLWQKDNLISTGVYYDTLDSKPVPTPAFSMVSNMSLSTVRVCLGNSVNFADGSYNAPITKWTWDFGSGATPQTYTGKTPPAVTYSSKGYKTITLKVENANGSNTLVATDYLYVEGPDDSQKGAVKYADWDYENDFLEKGWYFENETPTNPWVRVTDAKYDGIASLKIDAKATSNAFVYSLVSPSYDMTGAASPYVSFNYAFAPNLTTNPSPTPSVGATIDSQDGLNIYVSYDCGRTWISKKYVGGQPTNPTKAKNDLSTLTSSGATTGIQSSVNFVPTSLSQWKNMSTPSGAITKQNNVRFKISFTCSGGNNFYIDNLMMGLTTGVNDLTKSDLHFSVQPNPFSTETKFTYELPVKANVEVQLYDIVGKEVATLQKGVQEAGAQELIIDRSQLKLNTGIYFVKFQVGDSNFSHKIMVN